MNNPLLVLNTDSEQKARKVHAQVVNLIINHPRSQWEKSYSAIKEFSNSNEILKDKNYKENIKRKQKLNNIDKLQFRTIWDEFAKVMNDEEMWDDFIKNRNQFVWDCLSEIGSTIFALFIIFLLAVKNQHRGGNNGGPKTVLISFG